MASGRRAIDAVMAGLVPAIHVLPPATKKDVDARHETGHDERTVVSIQKRMQ
jgi:hypothetical protein